jgi:signal recognition particle subunit SRP54
VFDELTKKLESVFRTLRGHGRLTESNISEALREVRRALLESDVHFQVTRDFIKEVQQKAVGQEVLRSITPGQQVIKVVHQEMIRLLGEEAVPLLTASVLPTVIMLVGLQGSGKTTTCAKLALHCRKRGRKPLLVAADVYRPAAIEQLKVLSRQLDISFFATESQEPVEIAQAGVHYARKESRDTVILDTAGRLHIDQEMMEELRKIDEAVHPTEVLLVANSMTGQDAVKAATEFHQQLPLTGIILTMLDGDARGGAALSIRAVTGVPIKFVGVGEKPDALEVFHPERMASRILGMGDVLTLVEKAQESVDREQAEKIAARFQEGDFNLEDFLDQIRQLKKMGPMEDILAMIPGLGSKIKQFRVDEEMFRRTEAMICSMTVAERRKPGIIDGSRRKRIARGSGTRVQDVNQLLNQYHQMKDLMKRMTKGSFRKSFLGKLPFPGLS